VVAFPGRWPRKNQQSPLKRLTPSTEHLGQRKPVWLIVLVFFQHLSSVATLGFVSASLVVYIWTVYTQQLWNQEYRKLLTLQRHERQLIGANETLKQQLANQANAQDNGLVDPSLDSKLFLKPAPGPYLNPVPTTPAPGDLKLDMPLGY
jgi:hypothetical protein